MLLSPGAGTAAADKQIDQLGLTAPSTRPQRDILRLVGPRPAFASLGRLHPSSSPCRPETELPARSAGERRRQHRRGSPPLPETEGGSAASIPNGVAAGTSVATALSTPEPHTVWHGWVPCASPFRGGPPGGRRADRQRSPPGGPGWPRRCTAKISPKPAVGLLTCL